GRPWADHARRRRQYRGDAKRGHLYRRSGQLRGSDAGGGAGGHGGHNGRRPQDLVHASGVEYGALSRHGAGARGVAAMTSRVDITNRALQALGTRSSIVSMSEGSNESNQASLCYDATRQELIRT